MMINVLEFRFLICSYLPGLPLAFISASKIFKVGEEQPLLYWIAVPLIIGLFLDALRHLIEFHYEIFPTLPSKKEVLDKIAEFILLKYETFYHMYEFFANLFISLVITTLVNGGLILWYKGNSLEPLACMIMIGALFASFGGGCIFRWEAVKLKRGI